MDVSNDAPDANVDSNDDQFIFTHGSTTLQPAFINTSVLFQPNNLSLARPVRAWERKAISPFVHRKSRTGKIWKRAGAISKTATRSVLPALPSNTKSTKRMKAEDDVAIGTQWESLASPVKRITTRSTATKDLIALSDEEPVVDASIRQKDVEGTLIEVFNEDGTLTSLEDQGEQEQQGWADEEEFDDTLLHLEEAIQHETCYTLANDLHEEATNDEKDTEAVDGDTLSNRGLEEAKQDTSRHSSDHEDADHTATINSCQPETTDLANMAASTFRNERQIHHPLPAGFVSPIKRRRSVSKRLQDANRRRTLPHAFAPVLQLTSQEETSVEHLSDTTQEQEYGQDANQQAEGTLSVEMHDIEAENEWEDIENDDGTISPTSELCGGVQQALDEPELTQHPSTLPQDTVAYSSELHSPDAKTMNLRRSPRRKSSSPLKSRAGSYSQNLSHIVAFTPIKQANRQTVDRSPTPAVSTNSPNIVPQTPPTREININLPRDLNLIKGSPSQTRRSAALRLSDDTALLQAFLDRAAQSKTAEAAKRQQEEEAATFHSPLKIEVLFERDPNISAPTKASTGQDIMSEGSAIANVEDDSDALNNTARKVPRDSRQTRRSERSHTAPAKITLRGIAETAHKRRTPAQELFLLTGKNTRANKADAVAPKHRIPALMRELLQLSAEHQGIKQSTKQKSVTWNKTLVSSTLEPEPLDDDTESPPLLDDEADVEPTTASEASTTSEVVEHPIVRQSTPGKRRVRHLKAPASQMPSLSECISATQVKPPTSIPQVSRIRKPSSIATPLKPVSLVSNATLIPQRAPVGLGLRKPQIRMASRLPAPITSMDDEITNKLTASPPKKRASLFMPKIDADVTRSDADMLPGLASPAKKPKRPMVFGGESHDMKQNDFTGKLKELSALSSPAKKRARKAY